MTASPVVWREGRLEGTLMPFAEGGCTGVEKDGKGSAQQRAAHKKTLKIARTAELLDISPQTIRLYERNGILRCQKGDENGYRYFDRININVLTWARIYRSLGFSMEEARKLLNDCDAENALAHYERRVREMDEEILRARMQRQMLVERKERIEFAMAHLGEISIGAMPEYYYCTMHTNDRFDLDDEMAGRIREWNAYYPFMWSACLLPMESFEKGDDVWLGIRMILAQHAREMQVDVTPPVVHVPQRRCVYTCFRRENEACQSFRHNLQYVLDDMRRKGMACTGNVLVQPLLILQKTSKNVLYAQAWFPID